MKVCACLFTVLTLMNLLKSSILRLPYWNVQIVWNILALAAKLFDYQKVLFYHV